MEIIGFSEVITMMGSFAVVIALLAATLFGIKRYSAVMGISGQQKIELIEVKNLGGRQKLVLIGINGEQLLIGVSPHSLTQLAIWNKDACAINSQSELREQEVSPDKVSRNATGFGALLAKVKTGLKD